MPQRFSNLFQWIVLVSVGFILVIFIEGPRDIPHPVKSTFFWSQRAEQSEANSTTVPEGNTNQQVFSQPSVDKCAAAESHFNAAINLHDVELRRRRLREFIARFPNCDFHEDAVAALADLNVKQTAASKVISAPAAPPGSTRSATPQPVNMPDKAATSPTILPPVSITASRHPKESEHHPFVSMTALGERATLPPTSAYHLRLTPYFTTTISVHAGTIILKMDGVVKLECAAGGQFRVFTRGWSTFEVQTGPYGAQMQTANLQTGDQIGDGSYIAPW